MLPVLTMLTNGCPDVACRGDFVRPTITPQDCQPVTDSQTGFTRYECTGTCPVQPVGVEEQCKAFGGTPVSKTDSISGCSFTDCSFGENDTGSLAGHCPSETKKKLFSAQCVAEGRLPTRHIEPFSGCEIVNCEDPSVLQETQLSCRIPSLDELENERSACTTQNGLLAKKFDEQGCASAVCITDIASCAEPPAEAYKECAEKGGQYYVKKDPNSDCTIFAECLGIPEKAEFKETKKVLSEAEKLRIQLGLETLEVNLQRMSAELLAVREFRKDADASTLARFDRLSQILASIQKIIVQTRARFEAEDMSADEIEKTLTELVQLKQAFKDSLLVLLGATSVSTETGPTQCGSDEDCFMNAYRQCHPASVTHSDALGEFQARVIGLDEDSDCELTIELENKGNMECHIPDYAKGFLSKEIFLQYCNGQLLDELRDEFSQSQTPVQELCPGGSIKVDEETGKKYMACPSRLAASRGQSFNPSGFLITSIAWRR